MTGPVYILRHGETEWNRQGRMQGRLDSALTDLGRQQARHQGRILAAQGLRGTMIMTSPSGRAMKTADLVGMALGGQPRVDPALQEIDMGDWQGQRLTDLARRHHGLFNAPDPLGFYRHIPNGETPADVACRLRPLLARLVPPVILITHGVTARILRCLLMGLPVEAFSGLEGGQGVVYRIEGQRHITLR
ncbi:MAG: histidine phosphatase family protein [Qingshengfaniella sp.]